MGIINPHNGQTFDTPRPAEALDHDILMTMRALVGAAREGKLRNDTPVTLRADVVAYLLRHYEATDFLARVAVEGLDAVAEQWNPEALKGLTAYPRVAHAIGCVDQMRGGVVTDAKDEGEVKWNGLNMRIDE